MPKKTEALPPDDPSKDRLTFSAWPPKVDGVGRGVDKAYILALAVVGLLVLMVLVGAIRPGPALNTFAAVAALSRLR